MIRKLVPLFIFILMVVFLAIGLTRDPGKIPSPLVDKKIPEFSLPRVDDTSRYFGSSDLLGEVSLLNVWASWCVACRSEHPVLLELAKNNSVKLYGLNYKDKLEDAVRWLDYFGDPYVVSAHDFDGRTGIDFGVYGVPETFIIDKQGIIRYKHIGPVTVNVLNETILPIIQELQESGS